MQLSSGKLLIVVPYGNANAQNHVAYGNKEGDDTFCGRNAYGWSIVRDFQGADMDSGYTCQRCKRGLTK